VGWIHEQHTAELALQWNSYATWGSACTLAVLRSWSGEHGFAPILFGTAGCSIVLAGFSLVLLVPPTPPAASKDADTALQTLYDLECSCGSKRDDAKM
jgi:hypothetical protein